MLDEFRRAGANEVDRHAQIVLATKHDDREAELMATELFDQSPHTHAGKVHRGDDASAGTSTESGDEFFRAAEGPQIIAFGGQGLPDPAALLRRGDDDVDGIGQR